VRSASVEGGPTTFLKESKRAIEAAGGGTLEKMKRKLQVVTDN
jgi:hypothetical protein